jgi:lipopolysaccharide transport system ATP-binding protein
MAPAVVFDGVWKKFRRGERADSLRDLIPHVFGSLLGKKRAKNTELQNQEFWALKDVSFDVQPGQALGIIGPNGAGKSTTLKLLTKIMRPTRGHCRLQGRVGALIEVAAGFHPDLTGRENVFLQGAIMGMRPSEVRQRFTEIVDFAGVGDFIDTPVKRYSSGMNARLGFSIAAHLSPDVMVIDEALSVGDMTFQERCIQRMAQFKREGTAIVFVSHNLQAISQLCERAAYLRGGLEILAPTEVAIERYISDKTSALEHVDSDVAIVSAVLEGTPPGEIHVAPGTALTLRVVFQVNEPLGQVAFGFLIHRSTDHLLVYDGNLSSEQLGVSGAQPGDKFEVSFKFQAHLARGHYHISCHVFRGATARFLARLDVAASLVVEETQTYAGIAFVNLQGSVARISSAAQPVSLASNR